MNIARAAKKDCTVKCQVYFVRVRKYFLQTGAVFLFNQELGTGRPKLIFYFFWFWPHQSTGINQN